MSDSPEASSATLQMKPQQQASALEAAVLERHDVNGDKEDGPLESGVKRRRMAAATASDAETVLKARDTEVLSQGAEAVLTVVNFFGRRAVRKERIQKQYRHPELDKRLRSRRLNQELRMLTRLRKAGISVPAVYDVDARRCSFVMQAVAGCTLKTFLHGRQLSELDREVENVMSEVGKVVGRMHGADVVHGDLTTGNVMVKLKKEGCEVSVIDFGLSFSNGTEEDLAVDLYVFERAVIAAHSENAQRLNDTFLSAYTTQLERPGVISRLEDVRGRGRKRDMTG